MPGPEPPPIVEEFAGAIEARWSGDRPGTGVVVDFAGLALPGGADAARAMPLVRACGREAARSGAHLVDATAGLGYDAFLLAVAGFRVIAIERHPAVARLVEDGLRRALEDPHLAEMLGGRLRVVVGDAQVLLPTIAPRPEVVYLDPMYPPKKRASALPPKEMQIVRALVGDDVDSGALYQAARAIAHRVVVKRPLHAAPLGDPHTTIEGKLARFDVSLGGG